MLDCGEQIFDVAMHPHSELLAAALIDGRVLLHSTAGALEEDSDRERPPLGKLHPHASSSCRAVAFNAPGTMLYTAGADRSVAIYSADGRLVRQIQEAHHEALNRLVSLNEEGWLFATGDDEGVVKLWDSRVGDTATAVIEWRLHEDFVASLTAHPSEAHTLFSTSGDATLCCYDTRRASGAVRSDDQEDELTCCAVLKGGRKVACGTQDGTVLLFSAGRWGDCSDRYPGHPSAVSCMLKVDESTVLTGAEDGLVRVIALLPNKVLGVVADHENFPVEGMEFSCDRRVLATYAHDSLVRFFDVSMFLDGDDDGDDDEDDEEASDDDGMAGDTAHDNEQTAETAVDAMDVIVDDGDGGEDSEGEYTSSGSSSSSGARGPGGGDDRNNRRADEDSGDDEGEGGSKQQRRSFPTAAEKFYADL